MCTGTSACVLVLLIPDQAAAPSSNTARHPAGGCAVFNRFAQSAGPGLGQFVEGVVL